tara:strand:- start:6 stop:1763 length:1758 start_codon:yes stop_codon:yes gene_type:complete
MVPELKVDKISPPPARLSAFLYHTPTILFSFCLFLITTLLLAYSGILWLGRAEANIDYLIFSMITFSLPVFLTSYLVTNISWIWDGRYPGRYGLQAGATGSVLMIITTFIGYSYGLPNEGLAFGFGCMGGLWYLTLRTHGSAPARIAFPLSLFSPFVSIYFFWYGDSPSSFNFGLLATFSLVFASHFYLFLVDSPYKKAVGVSGTRHMSAFIDHFSTGDGRRLTKAIREICQVVETRNSWVSIRKDGKPAAFFAVPGVHPGPLGNLGGSNLPVKIESTLPGLGFAFHGSSTNDHNPLRDEDISRIGKAMANASENAEYSKKSRALISKGETPSAHVLNFGEGSLIFASPGDSDDILPELSARLESSSLDTKGERIVIDLHNQEGWGRPPLAAGSKEGSLLEKYAAEAISESRKLDFNNLRAGFSNIPGENLERGIGPGGVRAAVFENEIDNKKELTGILLWDANGLAPGMNKELQTKLQGKVDNLLISTTDNHFVNIKPGGFNPLSDSAGLLASANQVLDEAISDISGAESAMGTVYVDGVEIMGQGKQDKISAAANSIIEVARYSWLPIYSSATMFCMIAYSYI